MLCPLEYHVLSKVCQAMQTFGVLPTPDFDGYTTVNDLTFIWEKGYGKPIG